MARKLSVDKELDDMTECSICTEVFTDPRVLPCIHTFCLKCLLNYGKDRQTGDRIPCPLCRKEFTIPDDGLSGMQKNFFMEKLLHVRKLSAGKDMCEQHKNEEIKMFCQKCKDSICVKCFIKSHKTHDCSDIEEVSDDLRSLVVTDMDKVTKFLKKTGGLFSRLEKEKNDVIKHLAGIEDEINTEADKRISAIQQDKGKLHVEGDKLIAAIERDRAKLLSEVESIILKRVKQLETVKQEPEQHMTALESFKRYSETLLSSGTACDVTRSAKSLHKRADELMKFDVIDYVDSSLPPMNVTFTSSTLLDRDDRNLVGFVTEEGQLEQISSNTIRENMYYLTVLHTLAYFVVYL